MLLQQAEVRRLLPKTMVMEHLLNDFSPVTKAGWLAKIQNDLKGKPLAGLQQKIAGLTTDPFPHLDDLEGIPQPLHARNNWEISEDIDAHDILKADRAALRALEGGVEALRFILDENPGDHRMESLLEGIQLEAVSIHFFEKNKNAQPLHVLTHFYHVAKAGGYHLPSLRGSISWQFRDAVVTADALDLLEFAQHKLPGFKVLPVNAHRFFEGEDGVVSELAQTVAKAVRWLDSLAEKGISPEEINRFMQFSLSIGNNYFVEIAKLRALKHLWANVLKAYGVVNAPMPPIEAHLAPSSQTDDQHYNMIQSTTQAMAAVMGGADRLTVLPSDAFTGETSDFSCRIARNVQHILKTESHLDWVADPAAGSYFIENLTLKLAAAAWKELQQL